MQTIDERILELVNNREKLLRYVQEGTYSDRDVSDTLQDIEEEIWELRQKRSEEIRRDQLRNMTAHQAARELHKRQRNAEILGRTKGFMGILMENIREPLIILDEEWTSSVLNHMKTELTYLQAFKFGKKWYIAGSPEALELIYHNFAKKWREHNDRGRQLRYALDTIDAMRRKKGR